MPPVPNIVIGQTVNDAKILRSKELRTEMTPSERKLWNRLRANRLHGFKFRRQQIVDGFIVDIYCHAAALIVEVDGPIHDQRTQADAERDAVLTGKGLLILRFTNAEIETALPATLETIASICQRRTAQ